MIDIPSEDDFLREIGDEALENNRRYGLPAKAPTEIRRKQPDGSVAVWTNMTPAGAKAWTDDMLIELLPDRMLYTEQVDSWERDNDRSLSILHRYFPDQYDRIAEALWDARENVKQLRW